MRYAAILETKCAGWKVILFVFYFQKCFIELLELQSSPQQISNAICAYAS